MKKDVIYSMRMNKRVRDALRKAAERECRSVASLLDKVIIDYLQREGFQTWGAVTEERRRFPRKGTILSATTHLRQGSQLKAFSSVILDISMGGVLLAYPKGSNFRLASTGELPKFELSFELPSAGELVRFDCDARRIADMGSEIQIGATFRELNDRTSQKLRAYLI